LSSEGIGRLALAAALCLAACGGKAVEASGFARAPAPEETTSAPAPPPVASDRPLAVPELHRAPEPEAPAATGEDLGSVPTPPVAEEMLSPGPTETPDGASSALTERELEAQALLEAGQAKAAARAYSEIVQAALIPGGAGEDRQAIARWVEALDRAQSAHRWSVRGDWPSVEAAVQPGEGLIAFRKRVLADHPELLTCTGLIARANALANSEALQPGKVLKVPVERPNVLVDLSARWAFYRFGSEIAAAWPVGVGKEGQATPVGQFTVGMKQERPPWHPRGKPMVPYGDPENPLGSHWVAWKDADGRLMDVGFHGTSEEAGVGDAVSMGCVRMLNDHVAVLHDTLPVDAVVTVQP
jgi:hypothetical protein